METTGTVDTSVDSAGKIVERRTDGDLSIADCTGNRIVVCHNGLKSAVGFDMVENHALCV